MSFFRLASCLSMASTVPPARTARTSSIGLPKTPPYAFSGICTVGWTANPNPNYPTCSPHIPILPEGSRTTSPLATPSPRCSLPTFRPRHPRTLARPLVHTAPVTFRALTFIHDGARLYRQLGQRRADAAHPSRNLREV
ncbi:hypothetical protein EDB85DRAFT_1955964 [Lactarius pseudohatsudake]|nr:hypothetical protein EDB85DRAFT_1955964 [Lactarius pseudohatsudake]